MKIKEEVIMDAIQTNTYGTTSIGFCLSCGNEQEGCDPDAREYKCEMCEEKSVYGAEEILIMGAYE